MELIIQNEKYTIPSNAPQNQFYSIYLNRYDVLSDYIYSQMILIIIIIMFSLFNQINEHLIKGWMEHNQLQVS